MKFQDSSFNGLKVTVGTKCVTHPRMLQKQYAHQLFQSWGHNNREDAFQEALNNDCDWRLTVSLHPGACVGDVRRCQPQRRECAIESPTSTACLRCQYVL